MKSLTQRKDFGFVLDLPKHYHKQLDDWMEGFISTSDLPIEIRILLNNINKKQKVIATTMQERIWLKLYGIHRGYRTERSGEILIGTYKNN